MSGSSAGHDDENRPDRAGPCDCTEAIDRLYEYLDSELPEPDCLRVSAHLAVCVSCHDAADAERHIRNLLRRSCIESAPEGLRVRVLAEMIVRRVRGAVAAD